MGLFPRRPLVYLLPMVFPIMMAIGAGVGIIGVHLPPLELGIALSVTVLGALILGAVRAPVPVACAVVGIFALFHGYAHGVELPSAADPIGYSLGFVLATGSLHVAGIALGLLGNLPTRRNRAPWPWRARPRRRIMVLLGGMAMRGGFLPPAILCAALGLALAFVPLRRALLGAALLAGVAGLVWWRGPPLRWIEPIYVGCWLSVIANALIVYSPSRLPATLYLAAAINTGIWAGGVTAVSGQGRDLAIALPLVLLFVPGQLIVARGWSISLKVLASWLLPWRSWRPWSRSCRRPATSRTTWNKQWTFSQAIDDRRHRVRLMLAAAFAVAAPAHCQVIEIGDDGNYPRVQRPTRFVSGEPPADPTGRRLAGRRRRGRL